MREGILEQLPKQLPSNKVVFLVGNDNSSGVNHLKSLIDKLNRGGEWVKAEFRAQVVDVPADTAIALTMTGISGGTKENVRRAASKCGAVCPYQALTVGETKEILQFLDEVRKVQPTETSNNGLDHRPNTDEAERLRNMAKAAKHTTEEFTAAIQPTAVNEGAAQTPETVEEALGVLDGFKNSLEGVQLAVMVVGDKLGALTSECDSLRGQLKEKEMEARAKDLKILELEESLEISRKLSARTATLEEELRKVKQRNAELQATVDGFDALIRRIKK
jgi:hypothetical protein